MDESNIYANMDTPSGYSGTRPSFPKCSESVYAIAGMFQTLETAGPAPPTGAGRVEKRYRNVAVVLGLLCVLFLARLIGSIVQYTKNDAAWRADMILLQNSTSNLTKERDQLQKALEDCKSQQRWVYFNGSCYYMSSVEKSWQESRADCQSRGADLIIINSKEEQDFARSYKKGLWIGLSDLEKEGTWKWVDGTPLTIKFWTPSEPNGAQGRDEDCADIRTYELENSWNDEICSNKRFWICEKEKCS